MWSLQLREKLIFATIDRGNYAYEFGNYVHKSKIMRTNRELCAQIEDYAYESRIMRTNRELCARIGNYVHESRIMCRNSA